MGARAGAAAWEQLLVVVGAVHGLPVALIVLGETLRRRSVAWAVGLTLLLFVEEILVPETIFVAAPALACVVAAELVHRRPGQSLWTNLRLTRWCVGTGLAATAVWAAFLAAFGALRAFIDYYVVFGPGHNLEGAIPPTCGSASTEWTMFAVDIGCVLLTVWAVAIKVARRADWEARDWVAVAAAAFMALYLEKALGRFDPGHVWQVFGAGLPLVLLWSWRLLDGLGRLLVAWWRGWDARLIRFAQPVTAVLVPVIALGLVYAGPLRKVDGQHHLAGVTEASFARVGYAAPGAIDTGLLRDLDTSIRAYAGDDGPVFDMTNSLGYLYFLLGRVPGTRFIHVSHGCPRVRATVAHRRVEGRAAARRDLRFHLDRRAGLGRHHQQRAPLRGERVRPARLDPGAAYPWGSGHGPQRPGRLKARARLDHAAADDRPLLQRPNLPMGGDPELPAGARQRSRPPRCRCARRSRGRSCTTPAGRSTRPPTFRPARS